MDTGTDIDTYVDMDTDTDTVMDIGTDKNRLHITAFEITHLHY